MLITERIAQDKKFLHFHPSLIRALKTHQFFKLHKELREELLKSEKFVVPDYMGGTIEALTNMCKPWVHEDKFVKEKYYERSDQYVKYSKIPFQRVTIENNHICYFLEKTEIGFSVTSIKSDGEVNPWICLITRIDTTKNGNQVFHFAFRFSTNGNVLDHEVFANMVEIHDPFEKYLYNLFQHSVLNMGSVLEILLYINAKNRRDVEVKVSQGFKKISKKKVSVGPDLIYKVLILDRTKPNLVTTKNISEYIYSPEEEHATRRATYVRGHLKVRKTGTYWWNPFIRDAKNALTVGMVDKTYDVKIPKA